MIKAGQQKKWEGGGADFRDANHKMEVVLSLHVLVHNTTASLKQIELRSRLTEI